MLGCKGLKRGVLLPETQSQPLFLIQVPFFLFNYLILAGKKGTTEHAAVWVPDSEASTCMHCFKSKFTALNRRVSVA